MGMLTRRLGAISAVTLTVWSGLASPLHASPLAHSTVRGTVQIVGPPPLTQTMLDHAADPGIAPSAVVGMVNGWPITGKGLAQMEVSWANGGLGQVGSPVLRQAAFMALAGQIVAQQEAQRLGLWPPLSQAEEEAAAEGLPTTTGSLRAIQARDAMLALREHLFPPDEVNNATVWDAYVQHLLSQATIVEYPPLTEPSKAP